MTAEGWYTNKTTTTTPVWSLKRAFSGSTTWWRDDTIQVESRLKSTILQNLPIMLSFLAYYSQNYAHSSCYSPKFNYAYIFTHYHLLFPA